MTAMYCLIPPGVEQLLLPRERGARRAAVSYCDVGDGRDRLFSRPVALPLAHDCDPSDRHGPGLHHSQNRHVVRLSRYGAGCIGDEEDVVAVGQALDHRHCEADIRPERCYDELLSPRLLHRIDDTLILPRVDEGPIDWLLRGKDILELLEQVSTPLLGDGG